MNKILILGGTSFIGRNLVKQLVKRPELELTLFMRGVTNPTIFPELRKIYGDRNTQEIEQIFTENWDQVIDISCYYPQSLATILKGINKKLQHYIFISTCSVYDNEKHEGMLRDESAPVLNCTREQQIDTSPATYGQRKAACEALLLNSNFRHTIFRPALVYGAHDPTDRFYYWLYQSKMNLEILLPENGNRNFSITYVHDLVNCIEESISLEIENGIFNLISTPLSSIFQVVKTATNSLGTSPRLLDANARFLKECRIAQWIDIPLWLNTDTYTYSNERLNKLFSFSPTPFQESIDDSMRFYEASSWPEPISGIPKTKLRELIQKLKKHG